MKNNYNRDVMSDMPMESSFTSTTRTTSAPKTTAKPKINAIGTQKRTTKPANPKTTKTTTKTTTTTTSSKDGATTKTTTVKKTSTETSAKSGASKTAKTPKVKDEVVEAKDKKLRTKLTNSDADINDLEKLNESNLKTFRFKSKRNKVIIVILSFLLLISIVTVTVLLTIAKLKSNCYMIAHGDVDAVFFVDGQELEKFRTPANLQGNRIFQIDVDVRIDTNALYNIRFTPICFQKGMELENTLIYEHNTALFYDGGDGYYYSISPIQGGQTIDLCGGIILDYEYRDSLNIDNFKLEFHVYFEKI